MKASPVIKNSSEGLVKTHLDRSLDLIHFRKKSEPPRHFGGYIMAPIPTNQTKKTIITIPPGKSYLCRPQEPGEIPRHVLLVACV